MGALTNKGSRSRVDNRQIYREWATAMPSPTRTTLLLST